uniref:Uncharacterized protein n=1 Tax=Rhizophora mucronata TaxID=61149 RepID=A0A2P2P4C7_RHIMU
MKLAHSVEKAARKKFDDSKPYQETIKSYNYRDVLSKPIIHDSLHVKMPTFLNYQVDRIRIHEDINLALICL